MSRRAKPQKVDIVIAIQTAFIHCSRRHWEAYRRSRGVVRVSQEARRVLMSSSDFRMFRREPEVPLSFGAFYNHDWVETQTAGDRVTLVIEGVEESWPWRDE